MATRPSKTPFTCTTGMRPSCIFWVWTTTRLTYRYAGRAMRLTDVKGKVVRDIIA